MSEREKIIERIRQLRQKTIERGCTEAEAMAAAAKIAELMGKLGLEPGDIEFDQAVAEVVSKGNTPRLKVWNTIAHVTNTALILGNSSSSRTKGTVTFVGRAPYPDVAVYLREVCDRAITNEIGAFRKSDFYRARRRPKTRAQAVYDFTDALTYRLCRRLLDLFEASIDDNARMTAIVELKRRFPRTTTMQAKQRKERFADAAIEGHRAGGRINLAHGVGRSPGSTVGLIGGGS